MKKCNKCLNNKNIEDFYKDNRRIGGLRPVCKECTKCNTKDFKSKNYEKYKEIERKSKQKWFLKNKEKIDLKHKEWKDKNPDYYKKYAQEVRLKNPDKHRESNRRFYIKNKIKMIARGKEYYSKNKDILIFKAIQYAKKNSTAVNFRNSKRHARKLNAVPKWLTKFDLDYIKSIYIQSKELEKIDGIKRHVDHIIPLQGKNICGLHVPWNLQILTATENTSKGNRMEEVLIG